MHIVIDIPDNDYKSLVNPYQFNEHLCSRLKEIVRQGTLLPKGHGDLIDRGELKTHLVGFKKASDCFRYYSFDPDNYGIAYIDATEHIIINKSIR